jgi:hydroxymethylbilane synthase
MPLAAYARFTDQRMHLRSAWGDPEGQHPLVHVQASASVHTLAEAERLGSQVALALKAGVDAQTH